MTDRARDKAKPAGAHPGRDRQRGLPTGDPRTLLLVFPVFLALGLTVYYPCFAGPFVSDDVFAVLNPYVVPPSLERILDLFSPYSAATTMHSEYRPLWFLLHGIERLAFGESPASYPAYHVANVVLQSVVSTLLVLLFARAGLPRWWAIVGGALFLVHPANVEAVAWISQLTSIAALGLAVGALLLAPQRPAMAVLCFTLALLTKPLAAFALPIAALFTWTQPPGLGRRSERWAWLVAWAAMLMALAAIEFIAARGAQYDAPPIHADDFVVARTIVGNFLRYLVMSATGLGLSAFHQARPAVSWLDLWWLGGAAGLVLILWRMALTLSLRQPEGVFWAWALCSFAPISQAVMPFTHPVADRYLYFILPGLLGGTLLAAHAGLNRWPRRRHRAMALQFGGGLVVMLLVVFAVQTHQRAGLWVSFQALAQDSMRHYPDGLWAHLLRSRTAAEEGDGPRSAAELRAAFELGHRDYNTVVADPVWGRVIRHPSFQQLLVDMASWWIKRVNEIEGPNQMQLYQQGNAYWLRGDYVDAQQTFERALALGGPLDSTVRAALSGLRPDRTP